ncbi:MAG: acetate--CoA ligase family protein [Myxococcales bacterium]|nr:acetate--CoA ligase family protein [Myxococcales bacterium]
MNSLQHRLAPLLAPRSMAMIGASPRAGSYGHGMIEAARSCGFEGALYLVNPRYAAIDDLPCYANLRELPEVPEHVVLMLSNERLEAAVDEAIAAGVRAATIFASSYLDGDTHPPLLERLKAKTREAGLLVCGGNGMGFYNREHKVRCAMVDGPREEAGPVTLIAQSGSIFSALSNNDGRLAFNLSVSPGQEIATSAADYMDFALELPGTRVIALFLETIRNPEGFLAAAEKAAARDVPIVVVKVARTEQSAKFAASHSGAIAGDDAAYDALFERCGALRCDDVPELFSTCQLLAQSWRVGPGGIAAITDSGGERELLVDHADAAGVRFAEISARTRERLASHLEYGLAPENPLDAWGTGKEYRRIFRDCMAALMDDPDTALGVWVTDLRDQDRFRGPFVEEAPGLAAERDTPLVFATCFNSGLDAQVANDLTRAGIPVLEGMRSSLAAVRHAFDYRDARERKAVQPPAPPKDEVVARWRARLEESAPLDEAEGYALLRDFGVPAPEARVVESATSAVDAANALGFPVALKTATPGIAHKSDVGGVALGLADAGAVASCYTEMSARLGPRAIVTPMAETGSEIVFGKVTDAQFGPLVMIGLGGVFVETLRDVRFAVPPIDADWARRLVNSLKGRALLDGARGRPPADLDALCDAFARFSVLAATLHEQLAEIDVNPVMAGPQGVTAVDVLAVRR